MSKTERRVHQWLENAPTESPVDHVMAILDRYFPDSLISRRGSHITVKDKRLQGMNEFGLLGHLEIPVKGGQRVKREYLKKIARAVELIESWEDK